MPTSLLNLSSKELRRAASLREQIDQLHKELAALLGKAVSRPAAAPQAAAVPARRKPRFSKATRAKMAAAAKKRWAKAKAAGKTHL